MDKHSQKDEPDSGWGKGQSLPRDSMKMKNSRRPDAGDGDLSQRYTGLSQGLEQSINDDSSSNKATARSRLDEIRGIVESELPPGQQNERIAEAVRDIEAQERSRPERDAAPSMPAVPGALASQGDTYTEQVAKRDVLDRAKITDAIVNLLTRRTDTAPFALGMFGHWGSGKSSQIQFVKAKLDLLASPRFRVVDFNAWEHEHCENIGAALAQAVVDHFVDGMGLMQRVGLARRLALSRNRDVTTAMGRDRRQLRNLLTTISHVGAPVFVPLAIMAGAAYIFVQHGWTRLGGFATVVTSLGAAWWVVKSYVSKNLTAWFKQLNANAEKIRQVFWFPDFGAKLGSFHEIHLSLKQLCSLCLSGGAAPEQGDYLLIVVDDLDRCGPHVVKQVFDAVRLVANIPRVVTLVALDERIAYSAVEKHFAQFDGSGREPRQVARDYLAKVFQVAVSLQPASKQASEGFIRGTLFSPVPKGEGEPVPDPDDAWSEARPPGAAEPSLQPPETGEDRWLAVLPEEVDEFARLAQDTGMVNPRQLWRLKQAWFLLRGLVLKDGDGIEIMRPWLCSLFCREWILQSSAQVREQVESAIRSGAPLAGPATRVEAILRLLEKERSSWQENWATVDTFLLPAGTISSKALEQPPKP